jgi:hypothetical protein
VWKAVPDRGFEPLICGRGDRFTAKSRLQF